ncbi:DUF4160 domain-containing protein [Skermanella rosea]|uniref:DUF4160 domain-containing protein n=1 Tax=Skermanella rosea TaxID=1817965 RepID=UPI0019336463|nr:DUF4160 domain-containing protein [Skermanella rosea]UEM02532.1 DUF4160 domain-containing protein [Skermanella rosea]
MLILYRSAAYRKVKWHGVVLSNRHGFTLGMGSLADEHLSGKPNQDGLLLTVTVHRAFGFRFVMFSNDHSPAHVHVVGHGGEAKITLAEPFRAKVDWSTGISQADLRRIMAEVERKRPLLIEAWETRCDG